MKNLKLSDINPMFASTSNHTAARLDMPVCTALIWGYQAISSANSAIWGTVAADSVVRKQDFSAIWGTCGVGVPMGRAGTRNQRMELVN